MENKKILIADDENNIVQIIATKLRNNGFDIITADNGEDGYKLCCEEQPDLIVTDLEMPGMTGIELAEKIHRKSEFSDVPIILLATKDSELKNSRMEKAGIAGRLNKPFSPKELLACVENMLTNSAIK